MIPRCRGGKGGHIRRPDAHISQPRRHPKVPVEHVHPIGQARARTNTDGPLEPPITFGRMARIEPQHCRQQNRVERTVM